jgi:hypothetical protein
MSEVRIADELRLDAPIDVVWRAIEGRMVSGWHSGFSLAERDVGDHAAVVGLRI